MSTETQQVKRTIRSLQGYAALMTIALVVLFVRGGAGDRCGAPGAATSAAQRDCLLIVSSTLADQRVRRTMASITLQRTVRLTRNPRMTTQKRATRPIQLPRYTRRIATPR